MQIFIPTMGREDNQRTLRNLPKELQKITTLIVPNKEVIKYKTSNEDTHCKKIIGVDVKGIAATRQ